MRRARGWTGWLVIMLLVSTGCSDAATEPGVLQDQKARETTAAGNTSVAEGPRQLDSFDSELWLDQAWVGDLDEMAERGVVRALVAYSLGQYFLDGATQRGATYEALTE